MIGLYATLGGIVLLLVSNATSIYFAIKWKEQQVHRWLEAHARETSEKVAEITGEPLGTDAQLRERIQRRMSKD